MYQSSTIKTENYRANPVTNNLNPKTGNLIHQLQWEIKICHFTFQQILSYQKCNKLTTKPYEVFPTIQKESQLYQMANVPKCEEAHSLNKNVCASVKSLSYCTHYVYIVEQNWWSQAESMILDMVKSEFQLMWIRYHQQLRVCS